MKLTTYTNRRRTGFTLVEMLCVIAIIVVLVAMLLPAIFGALVKAKQASNRSDISQLANAVQTFQSEFKVPYVPSRIKLSETGNYDLSLNASGQPNNLLEYDSYQYIQRLWPRINLAGGVDWNGDGAVSGDVVLEGDQCLVFFLGGIPASGSKGCLGFSTNPNSPAASGGTRKGPFFEFQEGRLIILPTNSLAGRSQSHYSYQDPYRNNIAPAYSVYAYFSSYKQMNGYNRYYMAYANSDCPSLGYLSDNPPGVWPYAEAGGTTPRYLNPNSFQIISAGADGLFAHGTPVTGYNALTGWSFDPDAIWTASSAFAYGSAHPVGKDDMSNFYDSLLGVPQ